MYIYISYIYSIYIYIYIQVAHLVKNLEEDLSKIFSCSAGGDPGSI